MSTSEKRTTWRSVVALAVAVAVGATLLLVAFAWPATQLRPRGVELAVAGPPAAVRQVAAALDRAQPGGFSVDAVTSPARARAMVRDREAQGALLIGPGGPRAVVASQGSPVVAQLVTAVARAAARGGSPEVPAEDVAPLPQGDPRGAALAAAALPLAIAGAAGGALVALRVRGAGRRAVGAGLVAVLTGSAVVAVLHGWLGVLTGDPAAELGVAVLGVAAMSWGVLGAHATAGRAGLVLVEVAVVALGNPLSGASSAPDLLPGGWAEVGQALPPGAVVSALRSTSGFAGAGAAAPLLVLSAWAAAGLALLAAGAAARALHHDGRHTAVEQVSRAGAEPLEAAR